MTNQTTEHLAQFIHDITDDALPSDIQDEAIRTFVNWMGCTLGGSRHPATLIAFDVTKEFAGAPGATVIGHGRHMDALNTAYINCLASAAHAFDDTHLATVIHPTGPVASTLFALAERSPPLTGKAFRVALTVGIEVACQLGVALLLPPAQGQLGWYMTGVAGTMGAAAAAARALKLSHEQTCWALGIAGNQASGYRQTHGSMCTSFVPAHAARCGMHAALLAKQGFTASMQALEGENGFAQVFAHRANLDAITHGLGQRWEMRANAYKPYPCGIVIHPAIDACLALAKRPEFDPKRVSKVELEVNPLCLTLCDRPTPRSDQDAQVSVQHWVAASLSRGTAGLAEGTATCVRDPDVTALRERIVAVGDERIARDAAQLRIVMRDGTTLAEFIAHASGSLDAPMSTQALREKFRNQAESILPAEQVNQLLSQCEDLPELTDVGQLGPLTIPK